ncbi:MAG: rod-binding protein [Asticcacaulis sp.]
MDVLTLQSQPAPNAVKPNPFGGPSPAKRAEDAGAQFEAMVLSALMQNMFSTLPTDGPFGGGNGEEAFRSMMVDAMTKKVTERGGIGISDTVRRELLRLQESAVQ